MNFKDKESILLQSGYKKQSHWGNNKVDHRNLHSYTETRIEMYKYPQCSERNKICSKIIYSPKLPFKNKGKKQHLGLIIMKPSWSRND